MKHKKLTGIFMAIIMLFSVITGTTLNAFAAEEPLQSNTPITIKVTDTNGVEIPYSVVTVKAANDNSYTDTFANNGNTPFIPSYCTAKDLVSNYDISVKAAGYKEFQLSDAFTYYRAITFVPMNEFMSVDGNTLTIKLMKASTPEIVPITLQFEDSETGAVIVPDSVTVTAANDSAFSNTFEGYAPISFVPHYFKANDLVSSYDISVSAAGYKKFDLANAFTYYTALTFVPMNDYITVEGNTLTIKLVKAFTNEAMPITMLFEDYATGAPIAPDSVTVTAANNSAFSDAFQNKQQISFFPSYYLANDVVNNYNIAVKAAGYKNLNLTNAFTYYTALTFVPMSDFITVEGNTLTIKLVKAITSEAMPITMLFQDYATGAPIAPDSVTVTAANNSAFSDIFQNKQQLSFFPSYYLANNVVNNYNIAVKANGYKDFNLNEAFTYYDYITFVPMNEQISVNGNTLIIKLKK